MGMASKENEEDVEEPILSLAYVSLPPVRRPSKKSPKFSLSVR